MKLQFFYSYWGSEHLPAKEFISMCLDQGFQGMEINFPTEKEHARSFRKSLGAIRKEKPEFKIIAQQVLSNRSESSASYLERMMDRLNFIRSFEPDAINSHTGKDHFTFEENSSLIDACEEFSQRNQIPLMHEIHRGRFTFHSTTLLPYLDRFPQLKLTGDFSHWCLVSESLLEDQEETIRRVIPHIHHLHAGVGSEQASQVNDPFAPEWTNHVNRFIQLWQSIIDHHQLNGKTEFSITPEFGPFPYMPQSPFDQHPLGDQKDINLKFKELLISKLKCS